jgi:chromosome segregation ATPase
VARIARVRKKGGRNQLDFDKLDAFLQILTPQVDVGLRPDDLNTLRTSLTAAESRVRYLETQFRALRDREQECQQQRYEATRLYRDSRAEGDALRATITEKDLMIAALRDMIAALREKLTGLPLAQALDAERARTTSLLQVVGERDDALARLQQENGNLRLLVDNSLQEYARARAEDGDRRAEAAEQQLAIVQAAMEKQSITVAWLQSRVSTLWDALVECRGKLAQGGIVLSEEANKLLARGDQRRVFNLEDSGSPGAADAS